MSGRESINLHNYAQEKILHRILHKKYSVQNTAPKLFSSKNFEQKRFSCPEFCTKVCAKNILLKILHRKNRIYSFCATPGRIRNFHIKKQLVNFALALTVPTNINNFVRTHIRCSAESSCPHLCHYAPANGLG